MLGFADYTLIHSLISFFLGEGEGIIEKPYFFFLKVIWYFSFGY